MAGASQDNDDVISGINVTPLVDIVLVILVIFMVTTTFVMQRSIPVTLPRATTGEASPGGLLNIAVTKDGAIYLNGERRELDGIAAAVEAARSRTSPGKEVSAFVSADVAAQYGLFAQVVDRLRLSGVTEIALDTQPADLGAPAR